MRASGAIAASSLSALNLLAANPPRYPYNPTEEPREPLTLYISRVPGTRDIILSTLKPQRKNVTSEDVAHALYYVHLDLPSDERLAAHPQPSPSTSTSNAAAPPSLTPATATPTVRESVLRKPLPGSPLAVSRAEPVLTPIDNSVAGAPTTTAKTTVTAPIAPPHVWLPPLRRSVSPPRIPQPWVPPGYHLDENHSFENLPSDHHSLPPTTIPPPLQNRQLAGQDITTGVDSQIAPCERPPVLHAPISRKPVGPQITAQDKVQTTQPPVVLVSAPKAAQPCIPAATALQDQPPSVQTSHSYRQPAVTTTCEDPRKFVPFQLTLIRRDPSSGHQWNIGKIASVQPDEQSTGTLQKPASPTTSSHPQDIQTDQPSISIRLETSGYAKFRGDDDIGRGGVFARQVVMAYTKSWTAGIRNAFKRPSSQSHERSTSDSGVDVDKIYRGFGASGNKDSELYSRHLSQPQNSCLIPDEESHSAHHRPSKEHSAEYRNDDTGLLTRPGPGLKLKGYTFTSPWEGRCEFRTGNGGRSLTCRHILHPSTDTMTGATGGGVAGYNPLVIAQNIRDGQNLAAVAASAATGSDSRGGGRVRARSLSSALSGAAKVSELRFSLPHGEVFRTKPGGSVDENKSVSARAEFYGRFQDHLQQLQSRHRQSLSSSEYIDELDDNDEDPEMDLTLGRENAGGGARGKRAKLGKLIVYDDGFKMLDLVVAANLGVWWVSWERNF